MGLFTFFKNLPINQKPPTKLNTYSLWLEGIPSRMHKAGFVSLVHGETFNEAVHDFIRTINHPLASMYIFNTKTQQWSYQGRRAFDNETDARKLCG